ASFASGPPTSTRKSGRFESTSSQPYRDQSALAVVAVTPARPNATTRSRTPAASASDGTTTSAIPSAPPPSGDPSGPVSETRAVEPRPNQVFAGLSSVHGASATSTSGSAYPRPITAPATSLTGSAPGRSTGNRTRSSRSAPA